MFDLTIFPLSLDSGRERYELPGLLVTAAPRKAARIRVQDHLLIYCRFQTTLVSGKTSVELTSAQQQEILHKLADTYFGFSGSVTAGLRAVATRLNDFLLNRNLRTAQDGQTVGMLNMAVLHGDGLIVAHAGLTHTFVLTKTQVEHFDDGVSPRSGSGAGRGLGLSRQAIPRFYQVDLSSGDLMVVCAEPPPSWTQKSLADSPRLSFDHLRRRLLSDSGGELRAAIIRFQTGKGQVTFWKPGDTPAPLSEGHAGLGRATRIGYQPEPASPASKDSGPLPAVTTGPLVSEAAAFPAETAQPDTSQVIPSETAGSTTDLAQEQAMSTPEAPVSIEPDSSPMNIEPPLPSVGEPSTAEEAAFPVDKASAGDHPTDSESWLNNHPSGGPQAVFLGERGAAREMPSTPLPRPPRPVSATEAATGTAAAEPQGATAQPAQKPTRISSSRERAQRPAKVARPKPVKPPRPPARPLGDILRSALAPFWISLSRWLASIADKLPKRRDSQGQALPFFNIPSSVMLAAALIIPLVVATVAATVYFRNGRSEQYQVVFLQAQEAAQQANQVTDPGQQKQAWAHVYELVQKAETFQHTGDSHKLAQQALSVLDNLDGYVRLDYQPAVSGGFGGGVKISRIVATLNDVYLLDTGEGRILRLYRTGTGYEVDAKFTCGGQVGKVGNAIIGPLVDMVSLAPNNPTNSNIMGIDTNGNLVYCPPGAASFDSRPLPVPDAGWGKISGMAIYNDTLFVLDPKNNAVYYYYINQDGIYADPPHLYFSGNIPKMDDVIDLAVDQEFLYLLHASGQMTVCEAGGFDFSTTKCTDPQPYGDTRQGYDPNPLSFTGSQFTQIETTQPPDPSLYALDALNKSIYHLSLRRLNLQNQYRAQPDTDFPLPAGSPTAFTVAPNRRVLIAFGNQLFFAPIP